MLKKHTLNPEFTIFESISCPKSPVKIVMFVFQPLGRLGYQLDWIDGGLESKDKGLVFGPPVRFGLEGRFI